MIVIADSSALVALSMCQCLPVLEQLFNEIKVPEAVFKEVCILEKPEAATLESWLKYRVCTVSLSKYNLVRADNLGQGEREAIALYLAESAELLIIDDARAKRIAYLNGLEVMGSMGVLLLAKRKGLIKHIRSLLEILENTDIHLSHAVVQKVLNLANE